MGSSGRPQHVEPEVARLGDRAEVVQPGGLDEGIDVLRLDVDVDQADRHRAPRIWLARADARERPGDALPRRPGP